MIIRDFAVWRKMMKKIGKFLLFLIILFSAYMLFGAETYVFAQSKTLDSRARLLIHAYQKLDVDFLGDDLGIQVHFIPSGDLRANPLSPLGYVGLKGGLIPEFGAELLLGYDFGTEDPIVSIWIHTKDVVIDESDEKTKTPRYYWGCHIMEVYLADQPNYYWFFQEEFPFANIFAIGIEGEGWGQVGHPDSHSYGFGPNFLISLGDHFGVDLVSHYRWFTKENNPSGWELVTRWHIFF